MYPAVVHSCACPATAPTFQLRDPHPEAKRQCALFLEAMMRFFAKLLLALSMIKPLFPVLFPVLLPEMMPKVMWDRLLPS